MEKEYVLRFFTPADKEAKYNDEVGCSSLGIVTDSKWILPADVNSCSVEGIKGISLCGSYESVLLDAQSSASYDIKAGLVFFGNGGYENSFMSDLCEAFPLVPFVGGSAAIGDDGVARRLLPKNAYVSVFLITDDRYVYNVKSLNLHEDILCSVKACGQDPRYISDVIFCNRKIPLRSLINDFAAEFHLKCSITENISVSDTVGRNIHLIADGNNFKCGADITPDRNLMLRYVSSGDAYEKMKEFYSVDNSIVFGCAGIKSLLKNKRFCTGKNTIGLFMFGEVVCIDGKSDFGNLMLTRITINRK